MVWWVPLAAAGAQAHQNRMGRDASDKAQRRNIRLTREQMAQAQAQFDAQMDESIQRRVKDAELAGIHPLFAMGASSGASPTISAGGTPSYAPP